MHIRQASQEKKTTKKQEQKQKTLREVKYVGVLFYFHARYA